MNFLKDILFLIFIVGMITLSLIIIILWTDVYADTIVYERETIDIEQILDDLAMCESSNRSDLKIVDTNGYYSYGMYQFQKYTFIYFNEKYNITNLPTDEAIMNPEIQRELAKWILLRNKNGWEHWYNCLKDSKLNT